MAACDGCCGVAVACCSNTIPKTLHATVSKIQDCVCIDTLTVTLTYNSGTNKWTGSTATVGCPGGSPLNMTLAPCAGGGIAGFQLGTNCNGSGASNTNADASSTCSPLNLVFKNIISPGGCCIGNLGDSFNVTITP